LKDRTLLIDIGNSRIKLTFAGPTPPRDFAVIKKEKLKEKLIYSGAELIIYSSVNPEVEKIVLSIDSIEKKRISADKIDKPKLNYYPISSLGDDRVANILSAYKLYGETVAVVDFGTAITVDIIKNGEYIGGGIFPGISLLLESLNIGTKLVKPDSFKPQLKPGKSTKESVSSAITNSIVGMIKNYLNLNRVRNLVFTGGYGRIFLRYFRSAHYDPLLTLKGLYFYGQLFL